MKRLPLLITIGIVLVTAGGYYLYDQFLAKKRVTPWDLVPAATIFVYETNDCADCVQQLQETSLWSVFREAAFYQKPADSLRMLFDFIGAMPKGQLISAHQTRRDDFDFVFYVPVYQKRTKEIAQEAWSKLPGSEREFNGIRIHEVKSHGQTFSWTVVEDVWVGSFTPFLIEDVIRTFTAGESATFRAKIASVYQLPRIKNDAGNLYIHLRNFGRWLKSFASDAPDIVQHIGQSALLDVKTDEQNFILNGFSIDSASRGYVLSAFNDQVPVPFKLKNMISNRSLVVSSYGISHGARLGAALKNYRAQKRKVLLDSVKHIDAAMGVSIDKLYEALGKEIGVCFLEGKEKATSKIVLVETTKPEVWMNTFNTIAQKTSIDTVFFERFSDYEIREVPLYNFPEKLFWPLVSGLSTCYYSQVGQTILLGENVDDLKQFLDDIDKEETWGKSVAQNKFLESTLLEANVNIYINTPLVWSVVSQSLQPRWKEFIHDHRAALATIGMGAIQMSHLNNSYYTNVTWTYGPATEAKSAATPERTEKIITSFPQGIHKFFVVRNHYTKEEEVLVQDSTRALSLISTEGKVLWKIDLEQFIAGDVTQVDFFRNGKLQFFFATAGQLHVVDRLGNYVKPYPVSIREKEVEFASVIDYDHSKKYRFLVASTAGKLWMYDKDGNNLDGWTPKSVDANLFAAPQHHRIRGKDYVLAIGENGVAFLMNRRGEMLKNFPLDLDARPVGDYALEVGSSTATTYFIIVSRDGYRIKFSLDGKIHSRETLNKLTADSRFSMVREYNDKSYLVVRHEARALTVMDSELKEIITNESVSNNPANVRYYNFGGGEIYITVTDLSQDLSFLYNNEGNLLTTLPLESNAITIRPQQDQLKIYTALGEALTLQLR